MAGQPQSLKARALQWLAQREQSRAELRRKLMRLARQRALHADDGATDASAEVEALLDWLAVHRYLSDARFIESRVQARTARYGNRRIHLELAQHGMVVDATTAEQLQSSELARARAVWLRRFGPQAAADADARAKQMRFLAGRGFSTEVIRRVLRGGVDNNQGE